MAEEISEVWWRRKERVAPLREPYCVPACLVGLVLPCGVVVWVWGGGVRSSVRFQMLVY